MKAQRGVGRRHPDLFQGALAESFEGFGLDLPQELPV